MHTHARMREQGNYLVAKVATGYETWPVNINDKQLGQLCEYLLHLFLGCSTTQNPLTDSEARSARSAHFAKRALLR